MATGTNSLNQDMLLKVNALTTGSSVACTAATLSLTQADHANRVVYLDRAGGIAVTLPASAGTGDTYILVIKTTFTSNATIKVANATDVMNGSVAIMNDTGTAGLAKCWAAADNDDTVTWTGTTTGGYAGTLVRIVDYATGFWSVQIFGRHSGVIATPFSATVS